MYAYATLTAERPNVLTLPVSAILTQGDVLQGYQSYCFVVEVGKARRAPIEIGARGSERVEVLKKQARPSYPARKNAGRTSPARNRSSRAIRRP